MRADRRWLSLSIGDWLLTASAEGLTVSYGKLRVQLTSPDDLEALGQTLIREAQCRRREQDPDESTGHVS